MLPSTSKETRGDCNPALFTAAACKRCRLKKLRCDSSPQQCKHCSRVGTPCLIVDAASKREYERGYVANLCKEIAYYEDRLHKSTGEQETTQDPAPAPLVQQSEALHTSELPIRIGDAESSRQNEGGSITSIAKLVAAAVTNKARGAYLLNLGNAMSEEQNQLDQCRLKKADFPTPEAAHNLLETYLNDPHILHPFLNRAQITDVFRCQASGKSLSNKDLFRFFMVCAIGALYLNRTGEHTAPAIDYYTAAMQYEGDALDTTGLKLAQNILLLVVFTGQHWMGIGNKWELTRLAIRICTASDLHKRPPRNLSLMEQQMRKRVFWSAYINERHASSNLGTPMAIQETDITTDLPIDADDDLIDSNEPELQQYRGLSEVTVQIRHIRIRQITTRIQAISRKRNIDFPSDKRAFNDIINDLDEWKNSIYISSGGGNPYNSVQWIHLNYYKEKLSCYKIMVIPPQSQENMLHLSTLDEIQCCLESAAEIPHCYRDLPWGEWRTMNWTCVQDLLSSGFIMLYCLHVIHELSQLPHSDPNNIIVSIRDPWFQKTFDSLYCCNSILSRISQHWRTVRNQQRIFEILTTTTYQLLTSVRNEGSVPSISQSNDAFDSLQLPPLESNYYSMMSSLMINTDQADLDLHIDLNGVDFDGLDWEQILSFPNTLPGTGMMDTERTRT